MLRPASADALQMVPPQAEDDGAALRYEPPVEFSGEEALGRYLDLHGHHMAFVNSAFGRQQDYAEYVAGLTDFDQIPRRHRLGAAYLCAVQHPRSSCSWAPHWAVCLEAPACSEDAAEGVHVQLDVCSATVPAS